MSDPPTPLGGSCNARFETLRELFAAELESGEDLGDSLAVNIDGAMVVDLWGGWADEACTVPWAEGKRNSSSGMLGTIMFLMIGLPGLAMAVSGYALRSSRRPPEP